MPEIYDPNLVKPDKGYTQKHIKFSVNKLEQLARLIRNEEKLHFQDESVVRDDYLYSIYLDKKKIAYGYESKIKSFPENLQLLISLIVSEVELHKLPGMA